MCDQREAKAGHRRTGPGVPKEAWTGYNLVTRGRLASTGMKKKLQRAQVQSPGKTVWNVSTANTELALAA
jgi:hypothetical protein